MKAIFVDTETTGLDPIRHDIWQLAYILTEDGKEVYRNTVECKPHSPWNCDPAALKVGVCQDGKSILETGFEHMMPPRHAVTRFRLDLSRSIDPYDKKDKAAIGGFNVTFDLNFISWWMKKSGDKYGLGSFTDYTTLDAAPLLRLMRHLGYLEIENCKLSTACEHYGIKLDNAHNAMADTQASMELYPIVITDFQDMLSQPYYLGMLNAGVCEMKHSQISKE